MGDFLTAFDKLMPFDLPYFTQPVGAGAKTKKKDLSKLKHTCPCCDAKAWAKQGMRIICGDCEETMIEEEV
jgi:ribosomal protein S27AE